jgi:hypothetical protein
MFSNSWYGTNTFRSDGRVMIDAVSFSKINPDCDMGIAKKVNRQNNCGTYENSVKEEELFMCAPSFYGFSYTTKKWGQLYVDNLDGIVKIVISTVLIFQFSNFFASLFLTFLIIEISFDDDAFDQLVMDPIKKELISSLVTSKHEGVDLISGKGGGCIFLLHGPPGGL